MRSMEGRKEETGQERVKYSRNDRRRHVSTRGLGLARVGVKDDDITRRKDLNLTCVS